MERNKQDLAAWVDARLDSLSGAGEWRPDAGRAWAVLRRRDRTARVRRAGWAGALVGTIAAGIGLMMLTEPRACANPLGCVNEEQAQKAPALLTNFKESGNPNAKITIEIYSDYQCPSCAEQFTKGMVPQLVKEYVKTGKVKLIHRDFPLPQHQYAKLAARYVNAAGRLGYYDAAVTHIYKTQGSWEKDGSIDAQMAKVLPPGAMAQARQMVQNDKSLDETVAVDMKAAEQDDIHQTPSMVIVENGNRHVVAPVPAYPLIKSYLDDLLKK